MEFIYNYNGLPFYNESEIALRNYFVNCLKIGIEKILKKQNNAWSFVQCESPSLIPSELINSNYTDDDVYFVSDGLVLKPETTPATYEYAKFLFNSHQIKLPVCVWQASQSFRKEQHQVTKNCRFKNFYQIEFQCFYSKDTKNDYQLNVIDDIANLVEFMVKLPVRVIESDRLPAYSLKTLDVEVNNGDKWMEVCSCSVRTDFNYKPKIGNKEVESLVLEIALGLDRLIYNHSILQQENQK